MYEFLFEACILRSVKSRQRMWKSRKEKTEGNEFLEGRRRILYV